MATEREQEHQRLAERFAKADLEAHMAGAKKGRLKLLVASATDEHRAERYRSELVKTERDYERLAAAAAKANRELAAFAAGS